MTFEWKEEQNLGCEFICEAHRTCSFFRARIILVASHLVPQMLNLWNPVQATPRCHCPWKYLVTTSLLFIFIGCYGFFFFSYGGSNRNVKIGNLSCFYFHSYNIESINGVQCKDISHRLRQNQVHSKSHNHYKITLS